MKHFVRFTLLLALVAPLTGCYTFSHEVGRGATGVGAVEERQWFALWGLWRLNQVDSRAMAGQAGNYTVTTQFTPVDVAISFFTGWFTIYVQTVTVER
jgi:hypothetical protein